MNSTGKSGCKSNIHAQLHGFNTALQCRACVSVLPYEAYINPDVGPIYGVSGQLDFMLLPLKWGFELLTDDKATKKDVDRQVC